MDVMLEIAGWCGGAMVGLAYVLVSMGRLQAQSRVFQLLNVIGGVLLTWTALDHGAFSNAVIDLVWVGFGAYTLIAVRARRRQRSHPGSQSQAADQADHSSFSSGSPTGGLSTI